MISRTRSRTQAALYIRAYRNSSVRLYGAQKWFRFSSEERSFRGEVADVKEQKKGNIPIVDGGEATEGWIRRIENVQLPFHGMFWNKFSHSSWPTCRGGGREVVVQSNGPLLVFLPFGLYPLQSRPMPKGGCNKGWHSLTFGTKDEHAAPVQMSGSSIMPWLVCSAVSSDKANNPRHG